MRGFLVRLLVIGMVPLLAVLTPETARAATTYGDAATADFGARESGLGSAVGSTVSCSVTGYWQAIETVMNVKGRVTCSTGYNVSSAMVGFTANGAGCSGSWDPIEMDGAGTRDFIIPMGAAVGSCQVTELCYTIEAGSHTNPWMDDNDSGCVPWSVGGPENVTPGTSCAGITLAQPYPVGAPREKNFSSSGPGSWTWVQDYQFEVTADATVPPNTKVGMYVYTHRSDGNHQSARAGMLIGETDLGKRNQQRVSVTVEPGTSTIRVLEVSLSASSYNKPTPPMNDYVLGTGYIAGVSLGTNWYSTPGHAGTPYAGLTAQSPGCFAYWGQAIELDYANEEERTPIGPVAEGSPSGTGGSEVEPGDEPSEPVKDETCGGFSLTDPSSWAGAGICAIVKAIGALVDVVTGLVPAIGDLLAALFMPHPSTWGVEEFLETVGDRPPFSLGTGMADSFESMADGWSSSSGCGGDVIDVQVEGVDASVTCSAVKNAEGMSGLYALAQAAIWGAAAWGIWNMLQASIERSAS